MLAEALREWLPKVLQTVRPWMSSVDLSLGTRWIADLSRELETTEIGIICVTSDNQYAPWLIFEAGALSKSLGTTCVIPYLLDLEPNELSGPLVQFQYAIPDENDTFRLVSTINRLLGDFSLSDGGLKETFDIWWPKLEAAIKKIPVAIRDNSPRRTDRELLEEILSLSRQTTRELHVGARNSTSLRLQELMVLTHQIQGPLVPAIGILSQMAEQDLDEVGRAHVLLAEDLLENTLSLAHGVSSATAIGLGQQVAINLEAVDVSTMVEKIARRLRRTDANSDLRFTFSSNVDFPSIHLDKSLFRSVLYALIHNATKFSDRDSEVVFECALDGPDQKPVLTITSTGEPINAVERDRIFEKYRRGGRVEQGRYHIGLGLGLWMARELMRHLGGEITLQLNDQNVRQAKFILHFGTSKFL